MSFLCVGAEDGGIRQFQGILEDAKGNKEVEELKREGIDLSGATIFRSENFPSYEYVEVKVPKDIEESQLRIKKMLAKKGGLQRTRFCMDLGGAEISVQFNPKTNIKLNVSTFQMLILLLFNEKNILTFKEILDLTGIPRKDLTVHIISLARGR